MEFIKLEELWSKLTSTQKAAVLVLAEALANRENATKDSVVCNTVGMLVELERGFRDSTMLRSQVQIFLEQMLDNLQDKTFEEFYRALMIMLIGHDH